MTDQEVPQSDLPDNIQTLNQEVPASDLPDNLSPQAGQEVPQNDMPDQISQNASPQDPNNIISNDLFSFGEGAAQGLAGPLATGAELALGKAGFSQFTPEAIKERQEENPGLESVGKLAGFGAGMLAGTGEARVASELAGALTPEAASLLGKVGANAINGFMQAGLFQASDEATKALLGEGDPAHPVATALINTGMGSLIGGVTGGLFEGVSGLTQKGIQAFGGNEIPQKIQDFLIGLGLGGQSTNEQIQQAMNGNGLPDSAKNGLRFWINFRKYVGSHLTGVAVGALAGEKYSHTWQGKLTDIAAGYMFAPFIEKQSERFLAPLAVKLFGGEGPTIIAKYAAHALSFANQASKGETVLNKALNNLFDFGAQDLFNYGRSAEADEQRIDDFISNGSTQTQLNQAMAQNFAHGGEVKSVEPMQMKNGVERYLPQQNMLLNAAKARVSDYLSSIYPGHDMTRLPYDSKLTNPVKERAYKKALKVAARPLRILEEIQKGTLTPQKMAEFTTMYPDIYSVMSKKMTKKINEKNYDEEKRPPYHFRQSLSLFLGSSLDSTLTPQNMAAAQATFLMGPSQPQNQPMPQPKGSKAALGKASQMSMTANQALGERSAKS